MVYKGFDFAMLHINLFPGVLGPFLILGLSVLYPLSISPMNFAIRLQGRAAQSAAFTNAVVVLHSSRTLSALPGN